MSFHSSHYQNQNFSLVFNRVARVALVSLGGSRTAATSETEIFLIIVNSHSSFYKARNPVFAFLLLLSKFYWAKKTAIVRNKHMSIMNTRKVTQYGFLILLQLMLSGVASETSSAKWVLV